MRIPKPFSTPRRNDSKTFQLTLNYTSVCRSVFVMNDGAAVS